MLFFFLVLLFVVVPTFLVRTSFFFLFLLVIYLATVEQLPPQKLASTPKSPLPKLNNWPGNSRSKLFVSSEWPRKTKCKNSRRVTWTSFSNVFEVLNSVSCLYRFYTNNAPVVKVLFWASRKRGEDKCVDRFQMFCVFRLTSAIGLGHSLNESFRCIGCNFWRGLDAPNARATLTNRLWMRMGSNSKGVAQLSYALIGHTVTATKRIQEDAKLLALAELASPNIPSGISPIKCRSLGSV